MAKPTARQTAQTADDLFDVLAQKAETVTQKGTKKRKSKPTIELTESEQKVFDSFCASWEVFKMAEGKQKTSKSLVTSILRRKILEKWIDEEQRTDNPMVQTDKARANFVVRQILKLELPEHDDGTPASIKERLLDAGFNEEEAEEISTSEFKERVEMNFRNINELRKGEPAEQKAVKKLLQLVVDNFTAEEQRLLLRKETKVDIDENFLDHAVKHCDSVEKLDSLLDVVEPQWVLSHINYSGQDLKKSINELTGGELPAEITSTETAEEMYSTDHLWKAVAKGSNACLYLCEGGKETLLGTKPCSGGHDHALSTCRKWLRDGDYRAKSVAEWGVHLTPLG